MKVNSSSVRIVNLLFIWNLAFINLVSSSSLRYILLKLLQSGVVLVHLAAQLTNTLLHLLVRFTLVLKHHFHEEEFALKEATLAHIGNC